jgi:hypothetical protein
VLSLVVVEANPVTNDLTGVLQTLKAVAVFTLLLERPDHPLDHPILLWTLCRDESLLQPIAFDQSFVAATGDFHDQRRFPLGCPAFDVVFHPCANLCFLQR